MVKVTLIYNNEYGKYNGKLTKIWTSAQINRKTKLRIFNSNAKSMLLPYTVAKHGLHGRNMKKMQVFINKCVRRILKVHCLNIITNKELWQTTKQESIKKEIGRRMWNWIGYTLRKKNDDIAHNIMAYNCTDHIKLGGGI